MAYNQEILIPTIDYFKWIWPVAQTVAMRLQKLYLFHKNYNLSVIKIEYTLNLKSDFSF